LGGNGDRTAYADLSPSSTALTLLRGADPSGVPIHTIAGIAENALRLLGCEEYYTKRFGFNLDPEDSDLLVSIQSARGGALPLGTTEELAGVCHTQETGPRLLERLPPLLNSPTASERFYKPGFPAPFTGR
jgi:hypothetical protein